MLGSSNSPLAIDLSLDASLLDPPRQTISLTAGANRQELVFLDATITEAAILTHKFENARVVRLDANVDGITQITNVLKQYQDIASVHIFSHGSESDVQLGNSHLNLANLPTYRENLKQWGNALTNNADLLFYGCNVGAGVDGSTLVQQISQITGADIAASNNFTGNTTLGGDWNLEVQTGKIEAEIVTITGFQGILPIYNGKEYLLTSNAKSWEDAQTEAKNLGGNLVTINDAAEENWLKQNLGTNQPLWIGLTDRTTEGKFEWVNGETATYRNWNPGEPNDYKLSGAYPGEDYAVMNQGTQWNDLPNNYGGIYRGIIERNADFTYDGKKYQLTNSAKSWEDAQAEAKNLGGNLVTINNAAEENWLKQTFGTNQPLWIGLTDRTTEGKFEWVNGETATYRNWNPGEPNDYKLSGAYPGEDYAVMNQGTQWNDLPNNYGGIYRGIIEIGSAPTTKPGTIGLETSTYQIGEAGSTANVAILRKDGSDGTITVDYRTVDASAKAGSDYQAVSGRVTFAPGETRKSIAIPILNDNLAEGNEDFNLTIDNVLGGATLLAPRTATITIQDDEAPTPLVTFNDFTSTSGLTLNGNATQSGNLLRLTTDNPFQTSTAFLNKPLAVDANTSFSTKFQFQLGGSQGTNGGDGFTFMLQNSTTANKALVGGGGNIGYGGISNSIAIEFDTYQNEFDSGNNQISVLRDGVVDKAVIAINAPFDLNSGNRLTAWIDYNGATNNLEVFLSNTTTKPGSATLAYNVDLSTIVGNQAFLGFSAATGGAINTHDIVNWSLTSNSSLLPAPPPPLATTTKPGTIGLETSTYQIGEAGSTANVAILRKDGSDGTITVDYRTVDASAKAGSDYQAVSGRVTFAPGETRKSIAIPILNDNLAEGNEDFNLTIDNVLGGATLLAPRTATITIQDDEAPTPLVTFNDFTSTSGLTLNGNATQSGNLLRLTTDNPFQTSTAFLNKPLAVDANTSFSTKFQFQLGGSQGTNGGDGFTFMLQNSTTANKALVGGGGNIGYGGISNSIAIEFDTYQNEFDSGNNQISVLRDGVVDKAVIAINAPFDLNSGNRLTAWIDYNGATNNLEVFLSNTTTKPGSATLAYNVDLSTIVGNQAFLGFSAATGGAINTHDIVNWSLTSNSSLLPAPPPPLATTTKPGTIGLETSTYQIGEAGSTANVAILRKDGSDGTITVDYRTVDASAKAGSDYQAVSGRVTFAPGETRKSIAIPILNDNLAEGNEDFNLTIDNVLGGATLLAPRTATITIQDDEAPTPLVTFNDFTSTSGLTLNGNATQSGNLLRLTTDNPFQTSTAFLNKPLAVDANTSFSTKFQFQLGGSQGTNGGDGFTFMLQNSTTANKALVGGGGNIGYGGISNSIAIEFDTYQNEFDSGNNQISVLRDGVVDKAVIAINAPFDLNSGNRLTAWIDYNGATNNLEVFLSNTTTKPGSATLAYNVDLSTIVGNQAFLGFSAATGGAINTHDIVNWSLTSNSSLLPAPPPPLVVQKQTTVTNLSQPISIDWAPDGSKMFIAEKGGVIKVFENGQLKAAPFIDLSKVVNSARDRGLLDIAVHPDFFNGKPYIYAYYTYDPAEVAQNSGLAGADGIGNRANRLTRITADAATNYTTAIAGSEVIILGKNSTWNNFNAFANSTVNFQEKPAGILADGTNLQDFINQDSESHAGGSLQFAPDGSLYVSIGDGTSYNQIDPRTVRVQDIDNLSGKVLRIDPITGAGLANNPFYNGNQDANRSKVYQSGFRNPFRISVDPRNGQLYVGDVGWTQWEEINAGGAGANFGWPYYEGGNGVSFQTGSYQDLPAAKAFYASGKQVTPSILGLNHAADGVNAIMLGDVYTGTKLPAKYQGNLFFNDLGQGIVRNAKLDTAGKITSVETFATGAQYVVQITQGPDGALYYVDLDDGVVGRWQVG